MCPRYGVVIIWNRWRSPTFTSSWPYFHVCDYSHTEIERILCRRFKPLLKFVTWDTIKEDSGHGAFLPNKVVLIQYACFRAADCQRPAGNHEYVQGLSQQVFSKQQRVQVYMRNSPRPVNGGHIAQLLFHFTQYIQKIKYRICTNRAR